MDKYLQIEVDWSLPVDKVFEDFVERILKWINSYFPSLEVDREAFEAKYAGMKKLGFALEDLSPVWLHSKQMADIMNKHQSILNNTSSSSLRIAHRMVLDIVVFTSLIPCVYVPATKKSSAYKVSKFVSRFCIKTLPPCLAEELLSELFQELSSSINKNEKDSFNLDSTNLLGHIPLELYRSKEAQNPTLLCQRMLHYSLCHLTLPIRLQILNENPTYARMKDSPLLHLWMLACSGCDEQYYLNTCSASASLSSIVSDHAIIPTLVHIGRIVGEQVSARASTLQSGIPAYNTIFGYATDTKLTVKNTLDEFFNNMQNIDTTCLQLLDSEQTNGFPPSSADSTQPQHFFEQFFTRHQLLRSWHKSMQILSSIFVPQNPVVLTQKIIPDNWHLSSKLMTCYSLFAQFFPGQPKFLARSQASRSFEYICWSLIHTKSALLEPEAESGLFLDLRGALLDSPNDQDKIIDTLWYQIARKDGILVGTYESLFAGFWTIGHLSYWKAVALPEKMFMISDPEIQCFKLLSKTQIKEFILDESSCVNVLDGTLLQRQRAERVYSSMNPDSAR